MQFEYQIMTKKHYLNVFFILFYAFSLFSQESLEDIFVKRSFSPKRIGDIRFMHLEPAYLLLENTTKEGFVWNKYDMSGKFLEKFLSTSDLEKWSQGHLLTIDDYELADNDQAMIVSTQTEAIYRHSTKSTFYIVNIKEQKVFPLSLNGKQMYPKFSPTKDKVAFVRDNNIYYIDITLGKETQVTTDGKNNAIINGRSDWVYEEEFKVTSTFEWSPDGKKIAYTKFDETLVPEFSSLNYNSLYPKVETFKYPKAGQKNAFVSCFVYDIKTKKHINVTPTEEEQAYYPMLAWSKDRLLIQYLNRRQNHFKIFSVSSDGKQCELVYQNQNDTYVILPSWFISNEGEVFLTSDKNGFKQIYKVEKLSSGYKETQLTKGSFEVKKIYGSKGEWVYCQCNEGKSYETKVYKINKRTLETELISEDNGMNDAIFSPDFNNFILDHQSDTIPNEFTLRNANGSVEAELEMNEGLKYRLDTLFNPRYYFEIPLENLQLQAYLLYPKNYDPAKKYPLLVYVYGGPGNQTVLNDWGGMREQWLRYLSNLGYMIACVDNRGSGGKGAAFQRMTYERLGKYETEDQITAVKFIIDKFNADSSRIGVFGWSYGGFVALNCLFYGNKTFKMGISVAPVTHWKFYDSIYTERFMGMPDENVSGYENYNPLDGAKMLEGKLLLIHGTADDNVHFQNSVELMKVLNNEGKMYDFMAYPDKNHGISGGRTRMHLFELMTNYIVKNL